MSSRPLPPLPPPMLVNIESTLGCNLACRMCGSHLSGATRRRRVMEPGLVERIEREVLTEVLDLSLTVAGEPLMTPKLSSFVALAERVGAGLQMNTNGTLVRDTPLFRRLMSTSAVIKFSVDAAEPHLYARIREGGDLAVVLGNIRTAVRIRTELPPSRRPRLAMCMVLMRCNVDQLVEMVDLAHGLGLDRLEVAHMTVMTRDLESESLRHTPDLADEWVRKARARADRLAFRVSLPPLMGGRRLRPGLRARARLLAADLRDVNRNRLSRLRRVARQKARLRRWSARAGGTVPCHFLQNGVFISLGGDVAPCPMPGRPTAGNLVEQPFDAIWNGDVLTAMRRGFLEGRPFDCCAHCSQNPVGYDPSDDATANPPAYEVPGLQRD